MRLGSAIQMANSWVGAHQNAALTSDFERSPHTAKDHTDQGRRSTGEVSTPGRRFIHVRLSICCSRRKQESNYLELHRVLERLPVEDSDLWLQPSGVHKMGIY